MVLVSDGFGLRWFWSQMVLVSDGFGLRWFWSQMVLVSDGFGLRWFWSQMVLVSEMILVNIICCMLEMFNCQLHVAVKKIIEEDNFVWLLSPVVARIHLSTALGS